MATPLHSVPVELGNLISFSSPIPYEYRRLGLCHPSRGWIPSQANLGELVTGDKLWNSPFAVQMQVNSSCRLLCMVTDVRRHPRKAKFLKELISRGYRATMYVDRIPVSELMIGGDLPSFGSLDELTKRVGRRGVPLGHHNREWDIDDTFVQTHFKFWIFYEPQPSSYVKNCLDDLFLPCLVEHKKEGVVPSKVVAAFVSSQSRTKPCGKKSTAQFLEGDIAFTYDVSWLQSNRSWTRGWNAFTGAPRADSLQHWWAVSYSLFSAVCIAFIVASAIFYTFKVDIARFEEGYHAPISELPLLRQFSDPGWKLIASGAFKTPPHCRVLCALVGSGIQLLFLVCFILSGTMVGMFRPSDRGRLVNVALRVFPFLGLVSGYQSARLNSIFGGRDRLKLWALTATCFPLLSFICYVSTDLLLWKEGSSGAVSFGTICRVFFFWILLNTLSTFIGSYIAYRKPSVCLANQQEDAPNVLCCKPWYRSYVALCLMFGMVPFMASYLQVLYVFSRVSFNQYANLYGFLFMDVFVMILSCMEASAIAVFWTLRCGEHDWWWKAFMCPATSGLYMFIALSAYFATMYDLTHVAFQVLIGHVFMISMVYALIGGAVGFQISHWFVNRLCSTLKPE